MKKRVILTEATARELRGRVQLDASGESRTKQSMKDECDINNIVHRYRTTGMLSHLATRQPAYLDVSEVGDYRSALEHVRSVGRFFERLPSELRAEFNNDPAEFLDAVNTNDERLASYGLAPKGSDHPDDAEGRRRGPDGRFLPAELEPDESGGNPPAKEGKS